MEIMARSSVLGFVGVNLAPDFHQATRRGAPSAHQTTRKEASITGRFIPSFISGLSICEKLLNVLELLPPGAVGLVGPSQCCPKL
jgi:hypothetical protein